MRDKVIGSTQILWSRDDAMFYCVKCKYMMEYNFGYRRCPYCKRKVEYTDKRW